jgi:truncated hemoglobin YjbI
MDGDLRPRARVDVVAAAGGLEGMRVILRDFYDRLFVDPMVGFFFAGRDKARLVELQLQFTARALGADVVYEGRPMPEAHAGLPPILPGHFDRRHKLLADVLAAHGVPDEAREAWLAYDRSFRRAVLRMGAADER